MHRGSDAIHNNACTRSWFRIILCVFHPLQFSRSQVRMMQSFVSVRRASSGFTRGSGIHNKVDRRYWRERKVCAQRKEANHES